RREQGAWRRRGMGLAVLLVLEIDVAADRTAGRVEERHRPVRISAVFAHAHELLMIGAHLRRLDILDVPARLDVGEVDNAFFVRVLVHVLGHGRSAADRGRESENRETSDGRRRSSQPARFRLRSHVSRLALQHSMTFTANPPRDVSLYLSCMSRPVSRIVLMTLSSDTRCLPSPRIAMRCALIALTEPIALRSMHGICTRPPIGSQVRPRLCSMPSSAAFSTWEM